MWRASWVRFRSAFKEPYAKRERMTFYEGAVRIQPFEAPQTFNRSWALSAEIEIPDGGAYGPIAALGGDTSGWSVYLHDGVPTFAYNFPGPEMTYIRASDPLPAGRHLLRYEFEKTGDQPLGPGGTGRLFLGDTKIAEGEIKRTCTVGYSMDGTFDIGWDKGSPVSEDYGPNARFTGKVIRVDFDLKPDFHADHDDHAGPPRGQLRARHDPPIAASQHASGHRYRFERDATVRLAQTLTFARRQ